MNNMKLTGKCKEDFEKWYLTEYYSEYKGKSSQRLQILVFESLENNKKYGVYIDFFDSVEIGLLIKKEYLKMINNIDGHHTLRLYKVYINELFCRNNYDQSNFKTLQEARIKAIEKANEIYNEGI